MTASEFSRDFELADAANEARQVSLEATDVERAALAERFDVIAIGTLTAQVTVAPHALGYHVTGPVKGAVSQTCVVTNAPLDNDVETHLEFLALTDDEGMDLDSLEEAYGVSEAALIEGSSLDLGELVAQYFGLAIDPFPRAKDAALAPETQPQRKTPFDVLASLKDKA